MIRGLVFVIFYLFSNLALAQADDLQLNQQKNVVNVKPAKAAKKEKSSEKSEVAKDLLLDKTEKQNKVYDSKATIGTESGGGGDWLEQQIFSSLQRIYRDIADRNYYGITAKDLKRLIDHLKIDMDDQSIGEFQKVSESEARFKISHQYGQQLYQSEDKLKVDAFIFSKLLKYFDPVYKRAIFENEILFSKGCALQNHLLDKTEIVRIFKQQAQNILQKLIFENPLNIDYYQFSALTNDTEIEVVDYDLFVDGVKKDAKNFFPQTKKIQLNQISWSKFFQCDSNISNLVYHEYLPYFFGNDLRYRHSRLQDFSNQESLPVSVIQPGLFQYVKEKESLCLLLFEKSDEGEVTLSYVDNPKTGSACPIKQTPSRRYFCSEKYKMCTGLPPAGALMMKFNSVDSFTEALDGTEFSYFRVKPIIPQPISKFTGSGIFVFEEQNGLGDSCEIAYENAQKSAFDQCLIHKKSGTRCKFEKSIQQIYDNACTQQVTVLLVPED